MEKDEFQAKFMFYIMMKGIEEVLAINDEMKEEVEEYEAKIQWYIGENIKGYQIFEEGKYSYGIDDEIEDPVVVMTIADINNAKLFFTGQVDPTSAYMSGDLSIEGNLAIIMNYSTIAEILQEYLEPLTSNL